MVTVSEPFGQLSSTDDIDGDHDVLVSLLWMCSAEQENSGRSPLDHMMHVSLELHAHLSSNLQVIQFPVDRVKCPLTMSMISSG